MNHRRCHATTTSTNLRLFLDLTINQSSNIAGPVDVGTILENQIFYLVAVTFLHSLLLIFSTFQFHFWLHH